MTTGTLTFHAAHNYGSMLQAYALQRFLLGLGFDNEIIDLRLPAQKAMYPPFRVFPTKSFPNLIQHLLDLRFKPAFDRKYRRFERFQAEELRKTAEFHSGEELSRMAPPFDYYITGSDQVWNVEAGDFDWSYFLPFAAGNAVSYAASFGPGGDRCEVGPARERMSRCLSRFKAISVREEGSAAMVKEMTGLDALVLADPVFLLSREEWESRLESLPPVRPGYILVYSPSVYTPLTLRLVRETARRTGRRVVLTNPIDGRLRFKAMGFEKAFDCGPWEFLQWLRGADLVMTTSFHAVAFSLLFERPFLTLGGRPDNRIDALLSRVGLESRRMADCIPDGIDLFSVDFSAVVPFLERERARSREYLLKNLCS